MLPRGGGAPSQPVSTLQPLALPYLRQLPTAKSAGLPADASETDTLSVGSGGSHGSAADSSPNLFRTTPIISYNQ